MKFKISNIEGNINELVEIFKTQENFAIEQIREICNMHRNLPKINSLKINQYLDIKQLL